MTAGVDEDADLARRFCQRLSDDWNAGVDTKIAGREQIAVIRLLNRLAKRPAIGARSWQSAGPIPGPAP